MIAKATKLTDDYSISRVINGGWQLSSGHALGDNTDLDDAHHAFTKLIDEGFTTFDCADIYTGVEEFIGRLVQERKHSTGKDDLQVHTKFVPDLKDLAHVDRAYVERVIERSLSRLGVERLDMVQFHWWDYDVPGMIDTAGELMRLQEKGLIRCISTTNFNTANLKKLVDAGIPVVTNQCQYSLLDRRPEKAMTDFCRRSGVKLIAYGTVAGGFLSDKWLGKPEPDLQSLENRSLVKYLLVIEDTLGWAGYQKLLERLAALGKSTGLSIAGLSSLYTISKPEAAAAVVGTRNSRHVADTCRLIGKTFPEDARREMDEFLKLFPQIEGDCFDIERQPGSRHIAIMRMNLVDSTTGK